MDPHGGDDTDPERPRHRRFDPAAPHTAPLPTHVPRWLAWIVLVALALSGALCTGLMVGG
jgi:hypothetical protein